MGRIGSLALSHRCRLDVPILLAASSVCLLLGVTLPMVQTRTLVFWSNRVSLWSMLEDLWRRGDQPLAVLVGVLSIGFPALKLAMLAFLWFGPLTSKLRRSLLLHIQFLSRWAMLDVFVAAVAVVIVQVGAVMEAQPRAGLYCFACSIVLSMLATLMIARAAKRRR